MFGLRKLKKKEGRNEMFVCGRRRFFLCNLSSLQKKKKHIKILLQIVLHWLIFSLETNKHINEHAVNQIQWLAQSHKDKTTKQST